MNICTRSPMEDEDIVCDMSIVQEKLIDAFEDRFVCMQGEAKAWFEIPQREGDPVRGVYVVYVVKGRDLEDVKTYFVNTVIIPLASKALRPDKDGPFLYWRKTNRVEVTREGEEFKIYTRICVLDDNLESIVIDKMVKKEGQLTPTCAYSAGAY